MLRMYAAAMAAALVTPAFAVPAAPGLSYEHTLVLASELSSDVYGAVEAELSALMTQSNGVSTTASIAAPSGNRRLQTGSSLTITYVVACGSSCDAVSASLATAQTDASFAASIIDAINTAATSSGFGNVVLSTPADVMATISVPDTVSITLPPAPTPPPPTPPAPPPAFINVGPADFATQGSCQADGDVLSVTQVAGSQLGQCYTPIDAVATDTVRVAFDMYCGDGSGADGLCVNVGKNSLDGRVGEDGVAVGIALCFDEWANGGDHGVMMFYNGATFWEDITSSGNRSGDPPVSYFEDAAWHRVVWDIVPTAAGGANVGFDFDDGTYGVDPQAVASYELPGDVYLGFTGRTGGATNNHWAKNIMYAVGATPDVPPAPPTPPTPPPPPPQAEASGGCTYTYWSDARQVRDAEDFCIENGGHLASAHSQADGDAIAELTQSSSWIGYHDMGFEAGCTDDRHQGLGGQIQATTFVWMDATPSDYENWAAGEPNDWSGNGANCDGTGNEDCTEAWQGGNTWNDADCANYRPFICGNCPTHNNNPTTFTFFEESVSKMEGEFNCIVGGGHLASLHSQADQDLLDDMVSNNAWIGYHDRFEEAGCTDDRHQGIGGNIQATSFVWTDGTASDYENWAAGEPNDWQDGVARCDGSGNEDCTEMWHGGVDWNDSNCDNQRPYICGYPGAGSSGDSVNVAAGLATGNCAFDSTPMNTNHACGGGCSGPNGVRRCGATSSSTVGWGGEPDRAIDGNADGSWGSGSCTHTDDPGSVIPGTHWWQIDLGASFSVDSVNIYHRTDCCQTRLMQASVFVSTSDDYTTTGTLCGAVDDHLGQPDTTSCGGATGQYVTVERLNMVITICELEVMAVPDATSTAAVPLSCDSITIDMACPDDECVAGGYNGECIEAVQTGQKLWMDRDYAWTTTPDSLDMLDGRWTYVRAMLGTTPRIGPVNTRGGFQGSISEPAVVGICCSNHCSNGANMPATVGPALEWTQHPGTYAITMHAGEPCNFFEANAPAGDLAIYCDGNGGGGGSCWASGAFFHNPGSGGGGNTGMASVTQVGTSASGTTVQLVANLDAAKSNVYAMAGTTDQTLSLPAAFQVAAPFGSDIGGVNPAFYAINAAAEFDSWVSVGPTDGTAGAALSSIGLDFDSWTAVQGLEADNGAVFWMNPADGPANSAVLAQITNAAGSGSASATLQGKSTDGADWSESVSWSW